jgi:transcription elongation GreA/GreB family factor
MSRAFVNEERLGETPELPPLPLSPHPNYVTPQGLAQLQQRLAEAQARLRRAEPAGEALDASPSPAEIRREIAWLEARIAAAILVLPPAQPPRKAAFGATVEVADPDGKPQRYRIVGEDEADPARGLVSWVSPLGKALIGAGVGDVVRWARPAGAVDIEVLAIRFEA